MIAKTTPARGRPKGSASTDTLAGFVKAAKRDGHLHQFIAQAIANDPKPHGAKARAYAAASNKFGDKKGLSRTTIDRRLAIFTKHGATMNTVLDDGAVFLAHIDNANLVARLHAVFTAEEMSVINNTPAWFAARILRDREIAQTPARLKTRRK